MSGSFNPKRALDLIREAIGGGGGPVALHEPRFAGREWDYVKDCIDTGWVSSVGAYVDRFEEAVAARCDMTYGVAVVNGTAALHVCLLLAGVGAGDEVLVPSLTFVATANAVSYCGAVPHFCDSDERTLGIDSDKLDAHLSEIAEVRDGVCRNRQSGRTIRALVPMHCFGHPCDMDALADVAERWGLVLVEDASQSLGSLYKGRPTGRHGLLSAISFNGNKIVTTGGGGAVVTADETLARRAKQITTTARRRHAYEYAHDEIGFNYRLPNINAALGVAQLEQLDGFLAAKRALHDRYRAAFDGFAGAHIFTDAEFSRGNNWLIALLLDEPDLALRNAFLELCGGEGIACRPAWTLIHSLEVYRDCPRMDLSGAMSLEMRIINVPSSAKFGMTDHGA